MRQIRAVRATKISESISSVLLVRGGEVDVVNGRYLWEQSNKCERGRSPVMKVWLSIACSVHPERQKRRSAISGLHLAL